ncbi:MAG TPA: hypothetical protein VMK12_04280 [Anaeromyxobacteraceae bacterium]|nr:hypothetical protein [Anaeromyxobacteraceae bacterium]
MAVNGVVSTSSVMSVALNSTDAQLQVPDALLDATQSSISPEGSLFGELASLSKEDPTRFKQVAQEISDKLKEEAGSATGKKAQLLQAMSDKFAQAAQTGDATSLKPAGAQNTGGHHGGHHHKHASGGVGDEASPSSSLPSLADVIQQALQDSATSSSAGTTA